MSLDSFKSGGSKNSTNASSRKQYTEEYLLEILSENPDLTVQDVDDSDNDYPTKHVFVDRFGSWSRAKELATGNVDTIQCSSCGGYYQKISKHWNDSGCGYPSLNDKQKSIVVGLMMGDGTLTKRNKDRAGAVRVVNTNKEFLNWIHQQLEGIAYEPKSIRDAEEQMELNVESDFTENANINNYSDVYYINTASHEEFTRLDWLVDGSKKIPESIPLNSTIVSMWYCSDGSLHWRNDRNKAEARITNVTEKNEIDKFGRMFEKCGFDVRTTGKEIQFNINQTSKLLDWLGEPPSGMEYKWEFKNREKYKQLKEK